MITTNRRRVMQMLTGVHNQDMGKTSKNINIINGDSVDFYINTDMLYKASNNTYTATLTNIKLCKLSNVFNNKFKNGGVDSIKINPLRWEAGADAWWPEDGELDILIKNVNIQNIYNPRFKKSTNMYGTTYGLYADIDITIYFNDATSAKFDAIMSSKSTNPIGVWDPKEDNKNNGLVSQYFTIMLSTCSYYVDFINLSIEQSDIEYSDDQPYYNQGNTRINAEIQEPLTISPVIEYTTYEDNHTTYYSGHFISDEDNISVPENSFIVLRRIELTYESYRYQGDYINGLDIDTTITVENNQTDNSTLKYYLNSVDFYAGIDPEVGGPKGVELKVIYYVLTDEPIS